MESITKVRNLRKCNFLKVLLDYKDDVFSSKTPRTPKIFKILF